MMDVDEVTPLENDLELSVQLCGAGDVALTATSSTASALICTVAATERPFKPRQLIVLVYDRSGSSELL